MQSVHTVRNQAENVMPKEPIILIVLLMLAATPYIVGGHTDPTHAVALLVVAVVVAVSWRIRVNDQ